MRTLFIVATPIGNLSDITLRALEVLRNVDLILCEDTRKTKVLVDYFKIKKPLISYHQHSKLSKIDFIIDQLREEKDIALVSDAGTPGISDPGNVLVDRLMSLEDKSIKIVPIPGPSALTCAVSVSGLPCDKFVFLGFLPQKKGREKIFTEISSTKRTIIFYESPHRILKTLNKLRDTLDSSRQVAVCRELTKKFEEIVRGNITEILKKFQNRKKILGEFVILISGRK
jgi:16S rRNA (cytidine1402-2'-O)-methyltransferase